MAIPRPPGPLGQILNHLVDVWDYLDSFIGGGNAAWVAYTPTFTGLSVGNGTITAKSIKIGRFVRVRVHLIFGSTSTMTGPVTISLPNTAVAYPGTAGTTNVGRCRSFENGGNAYEGPVLMTSTTTVRVGVFDSSVNRLVSLDLGTNEPFTWGNLDELTADFSYESAA